jgi:tetratricopeptide (TPR) repeat protein
LPPATTGALATTAQPLYTTPPAAATTATTSGYAEKGEAAFKSGDYNGAIYNWKHAIIDDPQNPVLMMMMGQALFATGKFDEAAGATQLAMNVIPKDKWGVVIGNYKELYGNPQDYTTQLRALEKAVSDKPDNPAPRFLLGFHYAYLGFPQQAVDQLDKVIKIAPQDQMAKALRDEMKAKLPTPAAPATPAAPVTPAPTSTGPVGPALPGPTA